MRSSASTGVTPPKVPSRDRRNGWIDDRRHRTSDGTKIRAGGLRCCSSLAADCSTADRSGDAGGLRNVYNRHSDGLSMFGVVLPFSSGDSVALRSSLSLASDRRPSCESTRPFGTTDACFAIAFAESTPFRFVRTEQLGYYRFSFRAVGPRRGVASRTSSARGLRSFARAALRTPRRAESLVYSNAGGLTEWPKVLAC